MSEARQAEEVIHHGKNFDVILTPDGQKALRINVGGHVIVMTAEQWHEAALRSEKVAPGVFVPQDVWDWLMGEGPEFSPSPEQLKGSAFAPGRYWWRSELRKRVEAAAPVATTPNTANEGFAALKAAAEKFCRRRDAGELRSNQSYADFKAALKLCDERNGE